MEIIEIFKSYVQKRDTDYAIMITGSWGSGKTFFWKKKIVPELERMRNPVSGKKYKCLYVSLNGIQDTSELMSKVISAKFPWTNTKLAKFSKLFGGSIVDIAL